MNAGDESTRGRWLRPLRSVKDNCSKTIIMYDRFPSKDMDGIRVIFLPERLTGS